MLVNPVNCVGVMGKGLALEFKRRYPRVFQVYKNVCDAGELSAGYGFAFKGVYDGKESLIYHAATKQHWRDVSRIEDIDKLLIGIRQFMINNPQFKSIAIPALGCGLGGLQWSEVKTLMERHLANMDATIMIYEPKEEEWKTKRLSN